MNEEDQMLRKEIIDAFSKFRKGDADESDIEKYSAADLRMVLSDFDNKRHEQLAQIIQERLVKIGWINEKKNEEGKRRKEELGRGVLAFLSGIIGTLVTQFLLKKFRLL